MASIRTLLIIMATCGLGACAEDANDPAPPGNGHPEAGAPMDSGGDVWARCETKSVDAATPAFPCDVGAIIEAKCQRCHDADEVTAVCDADDSCIPGPFELATWEDTRQPWSGGPVYKRMHAVIEQDYMPLQATLTPPVEPLTADEKARLLEWLEGCALPGNGAACP